MQVTVTYPDSVPGAEQGAVVGGAFDGASRVERMLALWSPGLNSADVDILPQKQEIDARTRDLLRNDAFVRAGVQIHKDGIVGAMYALNAKPKTRFLGPGFDETWEDEFQEEVETLWTLGTESPRHYLDASRHMTFTDMVRLAVALDISAGEVLGTVEWIRERDRPFATAFQFVDPDRLGPDPMMQGLTDRLRGGVVKDARGKPVAYNIRTSHPSDLDRIGQGYAVRTVPARKPWGRTQVYHRFDVQRPDQSRGVPEMVAALKEARITRRFRDIVLQNAVVNATFAATIESDMPPAEAFAALGGASVSQIMAEAATSYLEQIANYAGSAKNLTIDGVKIPHLYPGTKLNLNRLGDGGPLGADFEKSLLRYIAAGLGLSYEQLSKDYTETNYSSARASLGETRKRMNAIKRRTADHFATEMYWLWLEEAINQRRISSMPAAAREPGWLYGDPLRQAAVSGCTWIGASLGQIDELKETQAAVLRLKYNLTTDEQECARLGLDWRDVKKQRAREKALDEDLGIAADPADDNMMNAATGEPTADPQADAAEGADR